MKLKKFSEMNEKNDFKGFQAFMGKELSGTGEEIKFDHKQKEKSVADIEEFKKQILYIASIEDYNNIDIISSVGDLVNEYNLSTSDVKKVLDDELDDVFQVYLGSIYDEMVEEDGTIDKIDKDVIKWFDDNQIYDYISAMDSLEKLGLTITKK